MKIEKMSNGYLKNEVHFQFHTEVKHLIEKFTPSALGIDKLYPTYLEYFEMEETAIEPIQKSAHTADLASYDHERSFTYKGLSAAVKAYTFHFEDHMKDAAERLSIVFKHYGNLSAKSYDEKTASIRNLINDLKTDYAEDINTTGLATWVDMLEEQNNEFDAVMRERYTDEANKSTLKMREVRNGIDTLYSSITEKINALVIINGPDSYAEFIKELNQRIERFQKILAQRKGWNKKKNQKQESGTAPATDN